MLHNSLKVSNLFELLLYSSELGRFEQWFDCFSILFGVSPTTLIEEYENLKQMVQMKIEEQNEYLMKTNQYKTFVWIEEIYSNNSRKGNCYKSITSIGNTVTFLWLICQRRLKLIVMI